MNAPASYQRMVQIMEWTMNVALFFCTILIALSLITAGFVATTNSPPNWVPLTVELEVDAPPDVTVQAKDGTTVDVEHRKTMAELHLPASFKGLHFTRILFELILLGVGGYQTLQMRAIVRSLRAAHPFVAENALRLRRIAGLTLVGYFIYAVYQFVFPFYVAPLFEELALNLSLNISLNPILVALGIFIIAEVFNIGVKMREEQELTI